MCFLPWDSKIVIPRFYKSVAILIKAWTKFFKFWVGFFFSLKFRRGLSVKLGNAFMKIRWELKEKVEFDFVMGRFISSRKLCNRTKLQNISN